LGRPGTPPEVYSQGIHPPSLSPSSTAIQIPRACPRLIRYAISSFRTATGYGCPSRGLSRWQEVAAPMMDSSIIGVFGKGGIYDILLPLLWIADSPNHRWRSFPGFLNTGGWVRRRQWVRLMMRPADLPLGDDSTPGSAQNPDDERKPVWQGNAQDDWVRCRQKLQPIGTDRGKIALWRWWLAHSISLADSKKPVKLTTVEE
jgi:hypothetical protein